MKVKWICSMSEKETHVKLHLQQLPNALRMKYKCLTVTNRFQYNWLLCIYPASSWACPSGSLYSTHTGPLAISRTSQVSFPLSCMVLCMVRSSTYRSQLIYYLLRDVSLNHCIIVSQRHYVSPWQHSDHLLHGTSVCNNYSSLRFDWGAHCCLQCLALPSIWYPIYDRHLRNICSVNEQMRKDSKSAT